MTHFDEFGELTNEGYSEPPADPNAEPPPLWAAFTRVVPAESLKTGTFSLWLVQGDRTVVLEGDLAAIQKFAENVNAAAMSMHTLQAYRRAARRR